MQKTESRHRLYKINSKWITNLDAKCKTIKIIGNVIGKKYR